MQGVDLHLKHVQALGVYGWSGICEVIIGEWLEDISQNQVCLIFWNCEQFGACMSKFAVGFDPVLVFASDS